MDVRTNLASSPAGGTTADVSKDQDVNDDHPRTVHKREPNGTKSNVQPAKYNLQKAKDPKRQESKGQHHGSAEKNSKVETKKLPERGSVLAQKGRKENGNHLLNFSYGRNSVGDVGGLSKNIGQCRKSNKLLSSMQQHKYSKEQFVQSSCQFVVSADGDYSLYLTNPDILVDWKLIEQIKFYSSENLSCPICLHPPVAGRITCCGHIYCWPCILGYLHIYDDNNDSCRCPICYQYVHKNDLKSVVVITQSTFTLGDIITLRLMRREKHSLFVTPAISMIHPPTTFLSVSENADNEIYSKLLIANIKDIVDIIEQERIELENELQSNPEMQKYIVQALSELSLRKEKLQWKLAEGKNTVFVENVKEIIEETLYDKETDNGCCKNDTKVLPKQSSTDSGSSCSDSSNPEFYYFYQAEDGQHVYLHTINVRMLKKEYKELKDCPSVITGKLLEKESFICTEDKRKKQSSYLGYLPINSPFECVEIELKPPIVSTSVIHSFHDELNTRRKCRERKKREEKKREEKIIEEENKLIGIYPTPNIDIKSYQDFPQWQPEILFKDPAPSSSESASSSIVDSPPAHSSASSCEIVSSNTTSSAFDEITLKRETDYPQEQGLTFAAIVTGTRNISVDPWPSVKSKKYSNPMNISSNETGEITARKTCNKSVTGWPIVRSETCSEIPSTSSNVCDDKELYVLEPKSPEPETREDGNAIGKKKKKKGKGIVLFKTGMTTGYSF